LLRAGGIRTGIAFMRNLRYRYARGTVAQKNDHATSGCFEARKRGMNWLGAAKDVANDIGAMQPRQYTLAVADVAIDKCHVMHTVEWRQIGITVERADFRSHMKLADPFDQLVAALPVGDELGNRHLRQFVLLRERGNFRPTH